LEFCRVSSSIVSPAASLIVSTAANQNIWIPYL
jgi:hypothetical protein